MTRYGRLTLEAQRRQLRSDAFTAAEWAANNPILQLGELGSEKDTNKIKVGDGRTHLNANRTTVISNAADGNGDVSITDANSLYWVVPYNNVNTAYKLMSADGTIPAARHASLPAADGTYVLKLTISGGVPTLSWVAE